MVDFGYIYKVKIGDKFYFGQTVNANERKARHKYHLRKNKHANKYMQNSYNKYQEFDFYVVCSCPKDRMDEIEQMYIDKYIKNKNLLNINKDVKQVCSSYVMTEEHKEALSLSSKNRIVSDETRKLMSESAKKRIKENGIGHLDYDKSNGNNPNAKIVLNIENGFFYESIKEAAEVYGYKRSTLNAKLVGNLINNTILSKV